jgi:putative transposase
MTPGAIEDVMRGFKKALIERALGAEMSHRQGYSPEAAKPSEGTNHHNGKSGKTVLTGGAALRIDVPRNREGFLS